MAALNQTCAEKIINNSHFICSFALNNQEMYSEIWLLLHSHILPMSEASAKLLHCESLHDAINSSASDMLLSVVEVEGYLNRKIKLKESHI